MWQKRKEVAVSVGVPARAAELYREMLRCGFARPWGYSMDDEAALFETVTLLAEQDNLKVIQMYEPYAATYTPIFEVARSDNGQAYTTELVTEEIEATYVQHAEADWGATLELARARNAGHPEFPAPPEERAPQTLGGEH